MATQQSKTISFLSDIHGNTQRLQKWVSDNEDGCDLLVQLGDLGFGFPRISVPQFGSKVALLRGNHDSPLVARNHPNYIGDFGFKASFDLFYLGGAWSIDHAWRTPGVSWWYDEELSDADFERAFELWCQKKPGLVVTHDCPKQAYPQVMSLGLGYIPSRTSEWLGRFFEAHKPKLWVFGHHHQDADFEVEGTRFLCLGIDQEKTIEWEVRGGTQEDQAAFDLGTEQ